MNKQAKIKDKSPDLLKVKKRLINIKISPNININFSKGLILDPLKKRKYKIGGIVKL